MGVIAASAGNHALALAYHGSQLGIPVTVVMPIVAPMMKVQLCRQHGAVVIEHGRDIGEVGDVTADSRPSLCIHARCIFNLLRFPYCHCAWYSFVSVACIVNSEHLGLCSACL